MSWELEHPDGGEDRGLWERASMNDLQQSIAFAVMLIPTEACLDWRSLL